MMKEENKVEKATPIELPPSRVGLPHKIKKGRVQTAAKRLNLTQKLRKEKFTGCPDNLF